MKRIKLLLLTMLLAITTFAQGVVDIKPAPTTMLYRLAEIEVYPQFLAEYLVAAAEIQKASLAEELGVVCLFPTQLKEDSTQIRILEIYAS